MHTDERQFHEIGDFFKFLILEAILALTIFVFILLGIYAVVDASPRIAVDPNPSDTNIVYWTCEGGWFSPDLIMEALAVATPCKLMDGTSKTVPKGGLIFDAALAPDNTLYQIRCKPYNASGGSGPLSDPFDFRKLPSGKPPSTALCR